MSTLRIVQVANEMYAVQVSDRWGVWEFCEGQHQHCTPEYGRTWMSIEHISKYCLMHTLETANHALDETVKVMRSETSEKSIKVIKVIKKVKI